MKFNEKTINDIIKKHNCDKSNLLAILTAIQSEYNWLPPEALTIVAEQLNIPLIDVYVVASFPHTFRLTPRGKHVVTVCQGTTCHVRGASFILNRIQNQLGVECGCTTKDNQFALETVNCLGACALAPIVVVDGKCHGQATVRKTDTLLAQHSKKKAKKTKTKTQSKVKKARKTAKKRTEKIIRKKRKQVQNKKKPTKKRFRGKSQRSRKMKTKRRSAKKTKRGIKRDQT